MSAGCSRDDRTTTSLLLKMLLENSAAISAHRSPRQVFRFSTKGIASGRSPEPKNLYLHFRGKKRAMTDQTVSDDFQDTTLIELTAGVVQSYLNNNQMQPDQVPSLMQQVHDKFVQLQGGEASDASSSVEATGPQHEPPVKPRNSVRKNDVVCLECGKTYKTLKRHIRTEHGMEEPAYKARWNLPSSMKLVAKSYSEQRSQMAKDIGLGDQRSRKGRGRKKG